MPLRSDQRFCSYPCRVGRVDKSIKLVCVTCKREFVPYRHTQRFCSPACAERRVGRLPVGPPLAARTCTKCGNPYQPIMRNQRTCGALCIGKPETWRTCQQCGDEFVVPPRAGGTMIYCSVVCRDAASRRRRGERFRKYELTPAQYDALVEAQQNKCRICAEEPNSSDRYGLVVDHDHTTGKIRGLLCNRCNMGIGLFDDDPEKLKMAIDYLVVHRPA